MSKQQNNNIKGTDGATLDLEVDERESLPDGLVRLPSGMIVITKLFCPNGHNMVDEDSAARFNGYPGIVLRVEGKETSGHVILSPIHGDDTKFGESNFEPGEVTKVSCPKCGVAFSDVQPCGCNDKAQLVGLFLDNDLTEGNQVVVCTTWGCLRSRILDRFQAISKFE
jgi:hypothetical protein